MINVALLFLTEHNIIIFLLHLLILCLQLYLLKLFIYFPQLPSTEKSTRTIERATQHRCFLLHDDECHLRYHCVPTAAQQRQNSYQLAAGYKDEYHLRS